MDDIQNLLKDNPGLAHATVACLSDPEGNQISCLGGIEGGWGINRGYREIEQKCEEDVENGIANGYYEEGELEMMVFVWPT